MIALTDQGFNPKQCKDANGESGVVNGTSLVKALVWVLLNAEFKA